MSQRLKHWLIKQGTGVQFSELTQFQVDMAYLFRQLPWTQRRQLQRKLAQEIAVYAFGLAKMTSRHMH